jgi:cytochrome bd-type quinol oxidase subunit 2
MVLAILTVVKFTILLILHAKCYLLLLSDGPAHERAVNSYARRRLERMLYYALVLRMTFDAEYGGDMGRLTVIFWLVPIIAADDYEYCRSIDCRSVCRTDDTRGSPCHRRYI